MTAPANCEEALADLDELAQSRLDLMSFIEEFKQILKRAQISFQVDDSDHSNSNDSEEIS
jgi:hypothetical protein